MTQTVLFRGTPIKLDGHFSQPGEQAHTFSLVNKELQDITLASLGQQRKILNIFPSIDTGVCATSVRRFNQLAAEATNAVVLCISADLPFAQARFCGAEGLNNVITLSTLRGGEFKQAYGVAIAEGPLSGLTARAVLVLDENNRVIHSQLVAEIADEPDYEAALAALK